MNYFLFSVLILSVMLNGFTGWNWATLMNLSEAWYICIDSKNSAILIKLLGLDETKISAVYEKKGSMKIGNEWALLRISRYAIKASN